MPGTVPSAGEIVVNGCLKFVSWWREIINKEAHKSQKKISVTDYAEG